MPQLWGSGEYRPFPEAGGGQARKGPAVARGAAPGIDCAPTHAGRPLAWGMAQTRAGMWSERVSRPRGRLFRSPRRAVPGSGDAWAGFPCLLGP